MMGIGQQNGRLIYFQITLIDINKESAYTKNIEEMKTLFISLLSFSNQLKFKG